MRAATVHVRHDVAAHHSVHPGGMAIWLFELTIAALGLACFAGVAFVGLCVDAYAAMVDGPKDQTAER